MSSNLIHYLPVITTLVAAAFFRVLWRHWRRNPSARAEGEAREVLRADLLTTVYDQPLVLVEHPFRDCPLVLTADETRT